MFHGRRLLVLAASVYLAAAGLVVVANGQTPGTEPGFTEEQQREFLLHAKIVNSKPRSETASARSWKTDRGTEALC
jgi:hypothetical protein